MSSKANRSFVSEESSESYRASIIIPAHDEEAVIETTLKTLTEGLSPGEFEILVICNGCQDRTAELSRRFSPQVLVEEIERASKIAALNHGDRIARAFPRIYLDADVLLDSASLRKVVETLEAPGALAAEPLPKMDLSRSSFWVRHWYRVWLGLYGGIPGKIGSGLFAFSKAGRERFGEFPDLVADDLFARSQVRTDELQTVPGAELVVRAPRTLGDLVRIKTRSQLGSYELSRKYPDLAARQARRRRLWQLRWTLWPRVPLYALITRYIRKRALGQYSHIASYIWERDESSREL